MRGEGDALDLLLAELAARRVRLWAEDGNLRFEAPAGAFSDDLKRRVRAAKPGLLARLSPAAAPKTDPEAEAAPASPAQEAIWLDRIDRPADSTYTILAPILLPPGSDPARVERAVAILADRHDALRTVLFERGGRLCQEARESARPEFSVHDVSAAADPKAEAVRFVAAEIAHPFDPLTGPLARFRLLRLGPFGDVLVCVADHLILDGISVAILDAELRTILEDPNAARPPRLAALPCSAADFARRRIAALNGARGGGTRRLLAAAHRRPGGGSAPARRRRGRRDAGWAAHRGPPVRSDGRGDADSGDVPPGHPDRGLLRRRRRPARPPQGPTGGFRSEPPSPAGSRRNRRIWSAVSPPSCP